MNVILNDRKLMILNVNISKYPDSFKCEKISECESNFLSKQCFVEQKLAKNLIAIQKSRKGRYFSR